MNMMQQFAESVAPPQTLSEAKASAVIGIIQRRGPICSFCISPLRDIPERNPGDVFRLRCVLMILDAVPTPIVCDGCFDTATAAYNSRATNVGTSNSGHANMALASLQG